MNRTAHPLSHRIAPALGSMLLGLTGGLHAQEGTDPTPATSVPTLERVEALPPEEEIIDLYRFENPVIVEPNRFAEAYKPEPSLEEIALEHGGLIQHGINLGLEKSWRGIKKVTGMRAQTQAATARPPPLDEEQLRRAARLCAAPGNDCASSE